MHTPCASFPVCQLQLSTKKQIVAVILDLLTKPYCTNTKLITSPDICSHMHKIDLSGQQLTAGDDFVCVAVIENMCVCIYEYICPSQYCVSVCACVSHSSCRYFISVLRLGEAAQLGMHCDSYNLTNWWWWFWFESELCLFTTLP